MKAFFNNTSMGAKMFITPVVSILFLLILVYNAVQLVDGRLGELHETVDRNFQRVGQGHSIYEMIAIAHMEIYRTVTIATTTTDEDELKNVNNMIEDHKQLVSKIIENTEKLSTISNFPKMEQMVNLFKAYQESTSSVYDMVYDAALAMVFVSESQRQFDELKVLLDEFMIYENKIENQEMSNGEAKAQQGLQQFLILALVSILISILLTIMVTRAIASPMKQVSKSMTDLASGSRELLLPNSNRQDEVGDMVRSVEVFRDAMIKSEEIAEEQAQDAHKKEERVQALTGLIQQARHLAEDMNDNVASVAASVHEMSGTSEEIRQQAQHSTGIVQKAVDEGRVSEQAMQELAQGANKIGEVIQMITSIAEQTNLLALNASIEAARAGEAGRGFAVVADEVKKLSMETSKATQDIQEQVHSVQRSVDGVVKSMANITDSIHGIEDISVKISVAVEEQNSATLAISESMEMATNGVQGVSDNINRIHEVSTET